MNPDLELRKLPPGQLYQLVQILEISNSWKQLMSIVPKDLSMPRFLKYKAEHIKLIENASKSQRRPCAEIFLDEWGTSGKKRPSLESLLILLNEAELFRAAEFVATNLLNGPMPERPETGPSASVDLSDRTIEQLVPRLSDLEPRHDHDTIEQVTSRVDDLAISRQSYDEGGGEEESWIQQQETRLVEQMHEPGAPTAPSASLPLNTQLPHHRYVDLELYTGGFCDEPLALALPGGRGRKLGTGAFGSVYLAELPLEGSVAVKRLNRDAVNVEKQFRNEVETLSRFRHPHLLPLLGYCCDGPSYCLVYEYMSNGSLQERLANKNGGEVIPWKVRVDIGLGTSRGILHLHTAYDKPLIHRDIKTANILLDERLVPKLGDFGLVRLGVTGSRTQSVAMTTTVFGTSAYMAPEAFRGDISVKIDTFSFGVVILELLTSLPPYDEHREGCDLVTHVEERCDGSIKPLLDDAAGDWGHCDAAAALYATALECLDEKRRRPGMAEVVERLAHIANMAHL